MRKFNEFANVVGKRIGNMAFLGWGDNNQRYRCEKKKYMKFGFIKYTVSSYYQQLIATDV